MRISEEQLTGRPKLYMLCPPPWKEEYVHFLREMEQSDDCDIYPVIPASWEKQGYEAVLRSSRRCGGIVYRSCEVPEDLEHAVTVFPVVPRDVLVKTALCIGDTFENAWIAACIERGSRIVFLRSGLAKFSGKETRAYVNRIMEYYRQVLEYGIEICGCNELSGQRPYQPAEPLMRLVKPEVVPQNPPVSSHRKKRVITAANVEQFASGGILHLQPDDIITDLAKDRARFLNIVFR